MGLLDKGTDFYYLEIDWQNLSKYGEMNSKHCVKSVQIRSFFWSVFSRIGTEYVSVFSLNLGKYGPETSVFGHFSRNEMIRLKGMLRTLFCWLQHDFHVRNELDEPSKGVKPVKIYPHKTIYTDLNFNTWM